MFSKSSRFKIIGLILLIGLFFIHYFSKKIGISDYLKYLLILLFFIMGAKISYFLDLDKNGWYILAGYYKIKNSVNYTKNFINGSGYIGGLKLIYFYRTGVSKEGICIKLMPVINWFMPELLIGWDDIKELMIKNHPYPEEKNKTLQSIESKLGKKYVQIFLKKLPDFNLVMPWHEGFTDQIPVSIVVHNNTND